MDFFQSGIVFRHVSDFCTSSVTNIKMMGVSHRKPVTKNPISLLARNQRLNATCHECDNEAAWQPGECSSDLGKGVFLFAGHLKYHDHDDNSPVALVNSPRLGCAAISGLPNHRIDEISHILESFRERLNRKTVQ
jgi:hypothetical protein